MDRLNKLDVYYHDQKIGTMALYQNRLAAFAYSDEWLQDFLFLSAAILETSHRIPNLDYDILMKLTLQLTKSMEECEKLYRLMCFNVFAHNRDDHSKNFSYIYRDEEKRWILSPAYDLTYSNSIGGEHATTVNGNGADPGMDDLLSVAKKIGLGMTKARKTAAEIQECVQERLRDYLSDRIE